MVILSQSGDSLKQSRKVRSPAIVSLYVNAMVLECQPTGCELPLPTDPVPLASDYSFPWLYVVIPAVVAAVVVILIVGIIAAITIYKLRICKKHLYTNKDMEEVADNIVSPFCYFKLHTFFTMDSQLHGENVNSNHQ
jgi:hypothetical protein